MLRTLYLCQKRSTGVRLPLLEPELAISLAGKKGHRRRGGRGDRRLREVGLLQGDVPLALLAFNLGVEIGLLAFVAAVFVVMWILQRIAPEMIRAVREPDSRTALVMAYVIGAVSAYWFLDRLAGFV